MRWLYAPTFADAMAKLRPGETLAIFVEWGGRPHLERCPSAERWTQLWQTSPQRFDPYALPAHTREEAPDGSLGGGMPARGTPGGSDPAGDPAPGPGKLSPAAPAPLTDLRFCALRPPSGGAAFWAALGWVLREAGQDFWTWARRGR